MTSDLVMRLHHKARLYLDDDAAQAADRIEELERVINDALCHLEADEPAEAAVILATRRPHAPEAK